MTEVEITAELLAELDGKAKEATPGPWGQDGYLVCRTRHEDGTTYIESWRPAAEANTVDYARFIAAASPATIIALVEHIRSLTERLERSDLRLETVRALFGKSVPMDEELDIAISVAIAQEGQSHE